MQEGVDALSSASEDEEADPARCANAQPKGLTVRKLIVLAIGRLRGPAG